MRPWGDGATKTPYGDWMLKFCVSVSWRTLLFTKGRNPNNHYAEHEEARIEQCEVTWREFLLGNRPHPGPFEQHFLIGDIAERASIPDLPTNFSRFMVGSIMMDIVGSARSSYTWSKLGQFQIFGTIDHGPNRWEGTKIHVKEGVLAAGKFVIPSGVIDLWKQKAAIQADAHRRISDAQHKKIEALTLADLDKLKGSRTFRAMQADAEMFGEGVVIRRSQDEG